MPDTAINILWTIGLGTFVLLMLAVGFIVAIVQSKRREIIAKQREMEELAKREKKYRNLFENSLAGMARLSVKDMVVLEANRILMNTLGATSAQEVKQALETIPSEDQKKIRSNILKNGKIENYDTYVKSINGTQLCITLSAVLIPEEEIIDCVIIDITEKKRLEAKQLQTQRIESIGILSSGIAHDIKNLLVPVKLAVEVLRKKISDASAQKILTSIGTNAESSIEIVQQVLSFVRGVEGVHVPIIASETFRNAIRAVQDTLPENVEIKISIPNSQTIILGDATQLQQVVLNLINNAKDAITENGCITVTQNEILVDKATADTIHNVHEGRFVLWSISDTGIGIPSDKIEKIFDPFFTTKEIGKGTGLGLAIVSGIVKGHKGFITVDSEVGKGSTFNVYLPIFKQE